MSGNPGLRFVADDRIPFLKGVLEPYGQVQYLPGKDISRTHLIGTDGLIIRTRTRVTESLINNTGLKIIATATIGTDHIDIEACGNNQVKWVNAPGCNSGSVYQYVAAALVFLARKHKFLFNNLTLGIIGVGNVGSKIERLAGTLGCKVLLNDPPRSRVEGGKKFTGLKQVLEESDIISFHVPLNSEGTDKTVNMLDRSLLRLVKKEAFIINTSRGEIIVEEDLKKALRSGTLKGAVLDVWNNEPDIDAELLKLVEIGTPHIAGYSLDGKANGTSQVICSLSKFFKLNLDAWYPNVIPPPDNNIIYLGNTAGTEQELLQKAIYNTYSIELDDMVFRSDPGAFELLRGNYPPRREFQAYLILAH